MELDLERPSHEQENVEIGPLANDANEDSPTSEPVKDRFGSVTCKRAISSEEKVDGSIVGLDIVHKGGNYEPKTGLEFDSKEAAYAFYRDYALSVGFGITIKASRRSKKSGKFIDVKIACSRFGVKRESCTIVNPRSCLKTGCKAGLHIKRKHDDKWIIYNFVKEHNHEICPEDLSHSIRGRNRQSGAPACPKKGLQLVLDDEDIDVMLKLFICMQDENPNFFYATDLDNEKRLRNVLWVDAKGRNDYFNFCDVVFFDTYYIKNKYKVPYLPVIGVNHHFQLILLGCALMGDENVSSFVWLMRTWLKAVGDHLPQVIITDQSKILNEAVAEVFPNTQHCFCLWHVLSKIPENLGSIVNQHEIFLAKFHKCIHHSWTEEQFEKRWWKMVERFEMRELEWVQLLYEDRRKWIPTYFQNVFLAGISTPERSGSITSFFDNYMSRDATFKEFLQQYKAYMRDRDKMEAEADSETQNNQCGLRSLSNFERQMSTIYTDSIFKKFQVEVLGAVSCRLQKESEDGTTIVFRVDDFEERQNFCVAWNESELNICCLCHSFEYRGILCKHAILVLQMFSFSGIPSRYIKKRWTREAKIGQRVVESSSSRLPYRVQRFNDLCKRAVRLSEEGSSSPEAYQIVSQALEEALKRCVGVNNTVNGPGESNTLYVQGFPEEENRGNNKTKSSKKKKMYKKRKVNSEAGRINIRLQDSCHNMEQMNSRAHTIANAYVPQQNRQELESGPRAPTLDDYYATQQNLQGMIQGQLNLISPIREGYYPSQQEMQGMAQLQSMSMSARGSHCGTQENMQGLLQAQLGFRVPLIQGCFDIEESMQDMDHSAVSAQFNTITAKNLQDKHFPR